MKKRKFKLRNILIGLIVCYVGYTFLSQQLIMYRLNKDIDKYSRENKKIEEANALLKDQIQYAGTNEYIEKMARERMGLIKPGETVYIIDGKE